MSNKPGYTDNKKTKKNKKKNLMLSLQNSYGIFLHILTIALKQGKLSLDYFLREKKSL